jgi:serine/threonine protein kinase
MRSICDRFAIALQSLCNRFAIDMQSLCNRIAIALQSLYNRFAITLKSHRNRFAIATQFLTQSFCNQFNHNQVYLTITNFPSPPITNSIVGRCGTPGYVAPDILQAEKNEGYPLNVDVFSIGVVAYVLLCGYEPFYGDTPAELLKANKNVDFEFHSPEVNVSSFLANC